jgi:hypothetical protein
LFEQSNFDHFHIQQVACVEANVVFQQIDSLFGAEREDFIRLQIGQLASRLVNRFQFLLLSVLAGDVLKRHQDAFGPINDLQWRCVQSVVPVLRDMENF